LKEKNMKRPLILVLIVMMLATLACSINVNLPTVQTGETKTFEVNEPVPAGDITRLTVAMGGGEVTIQPGADGLMEGTITTNVVGWDPRVTREGSSVALRQGDVRGTRNIPTGNITNKWDIKITDQHPLDLTIEAGAYKGEIDLSGVRLTNLKVSDGASESRLMFNVPNPERMETLAYATGASKIDLTGLANANFSHMRFEGGAGSYTLDFSGDLSQDASVTIKAGVCNIKLLIPEGTNAVIRNQGSVTSINAEGTWTVRDNTYSTSGSGPTLTIDVDMGVGNLDLIHSAE
jgi:hypothetical protein